MDLFTACEEAADDQPTRPTPLARPRVLGKQATTNKHRRRRRPRRRRHRRASPPQPQADEYPRTSRRAQYSCRLRRFGSPLASISSIC